MEPRQKPEDAPKEQYENLKTQCTYMLAELVNRHHMAISLEHCELPSDLTLSRLKEMLIADFEQMKRKDAEKDGKLKIVPKDEVKEHLGRSSDFGDTLMMRMFFELKPAASAFVPRAHDGSREALLPRARGLGTVTQQRNNDLPKLTELLNDSLDAEKNE